MKIVYTPSAREDLSEIKTYIRDVLKNPIAANNIVSKIVKSVHLLTEQSHLGISLQEKIGRETTYRCIFCGNYGIFYNIESTTIKIIRILDLRTDYMRIIFSEQ